MLDAIPTRINKSWNCDNPAMIRIDIRPVWRMRGDEAEREFDFQLVAILERLEALSSQVAELNRRLDQLESSTSAGRVVSSRRASRSKRSP